MPFPGTRLLLSTTVGYVKGKYQRMTFMDDAVEHAAMRVAEQHEGLPPDVFPAAFEKGEVKELIDEFDAGGDPITMERVAETLDEEMLDSEPDVEPEQLVSEFFEYLEQEISQDPAIGNKLQMVYAQRLSEYATQLREGQEKILAGIEVIGKDRSEKGYNVFKTVDERFEQELSGEHPQQRFDLPFYGRSDEVAEIIEFAESDTEVLVVSGPAGIGKTRLVVQASFLLQASHPNWTVYSTNVHTNLDAGLSEIEFDEEEGVILFIDDARGADQLERVFDIADRRPQVKLVFTERSIFTPSLEAKADRFQLDPIPLRLSPLDADTITGLIQDFYGIQDLQTLDWIVNVSEGKPLIAHLLAEQIISSESTGQDPVAAEDSVFESVFDDVVQDIKRAAEQQGVGDPQKLESYFKHVAAVGTLNTGDDAFMKAFRNTLSLDVEEERRYRKVLLNAVGMIDQRRNHLEVQPDALQEYIVYDMFFSDGLRDYMDAVYDIFGEFTEQEQVNTLLVIENRYDCWEADTVIDTIVSDHMDQMDQYPIPERVRLLRRFELLGAASPTRGVKLVDVALATESLDEETESEGLHRWYAKAPGEFGQLRLAAISLLSPALLKKPEPVTDALMEIALDDDNVARSVADTVVQQLNQKLRPGFTHPPAAQQRVIEHVADCLHDPKLETEFRLELLRAVASASSEKAEDFSTDPVYKQKRWIRHGLIWPSEAMQDFRLAAVDALIAVIEECEDHALKVDAAEQLANFVLAQKRYYGERNEAFNPDELEHIYEFAIGHVAGEDDLDCLSKLHRLVDYAEDTELDVYELASQLEEELLDHEQYRLLVHMVPRDWNLDEKEEIINTFIRNLNPKWEQQFDAFADVVTNSSEASFDRFFKLFGVQQTEASIQLLEDTPAALEHYQESVIVGICVGNPETGKKLTTQYIDTDTYNLACAGLCGLIDTDRDFAISAFDRILSEVDHYTEELVLQLSSVLRGQWKEDQKWTENMFLTLLHESEDVSLQLLDELLGVLPHREEELIEIDDTVIDGILDAAVEFDQLEESHRLRRMVEEVAARRPLDFVEFCIDRLHSSSGHIELLPYRLEVNTERMRKCEDYHTAVQKVSDIIVNMDEQPLLPYSRLFHTIPVDDVASLLADQVPNCSEEQLRQVSWYCRQFRQFILINSIENLLLGVMTEADNFWEAEEMQNKILAALGSNSTVAMENDEHEQELAILRDWQDNSDLTVDIQDFARKAEQYLRKDLDRQARIE